MNHLLHIRIYISFIHDFQCLLLKTMKKYNIVTHFYMVKLNILNMFLEDFYSTTDIHYHMVFFPVNYIMPRSHFISLQFYVLK